MRYTLFLHKKTAPNRIAIPVVKACLFKKRNAAFSFVNNSKRFFTLLFILLLPVINLYSQQRFCADSSIRIKYYTQNLDYSFGLFVNPDTNGKNIFTGTYYSSVENGVAAMKTNWGDSIYWAKKYRSLTNVNIASQNSFTAPGGTVIITGERRTPTASNFMICRIDTNGNMLWAKYLPLATGGSQYQMSSNNSMKNIFISNDAIYFEIQMSLVSIVGKMDLNGNLLWSRGFALWPPLYANFAVNGLYVKDSIVYFPAGRSRYNVTNPNFNYEGVTITKLKDADGSFIEAVAYSIIPDNYAKGFQPIYLHPHPDGSFSLAGFVSVTVNLGIGPQPSTRFNIMLQPDLNPLPGYYYKSNLVISNYVLEFDMNNKKQAAFLFANGFNNIKYFLTYDSIQQLLRSRKFFVPTTPAEGVGGVNLDDKWNIHFVYNYFLNSRRVSEYARLSDLSPANTPDCFGIDTASIFEQHPFILTNEPFVWDLYYDNELTCLPVTIYTENAAITKEVVCKQVSYCDSIKIKGNAAVCLPGQDVRYSIYQNPQCLKGIRWQTDTSFASVVTTEADTAITLHFKHTGSFYLRAAVYNCVVKDSLLISIGSPQTSLQLNRDSVLCPGGNILLSVNPSFKTYHWQDGSTQSSYTVTTAGLYTITAADSCGNIVKDSVRIAMADTLLPITPYYTICSYDTARVLLPADISTVSWQPVSFGELRGNSLLFYPPVTTRYLIQVMRPPCLLQKSITVEPQLCPDWLIFPSAFTPNNDGLNDTFKPGAGGRFTSYSLKIFNRSGQLLFTSSNPYTGWNGKYRGTVQPSGVYVFTCHYQFATNPSQSAKGTIMLLR